tara:strand:- start:7396 stop:9702 length:2307 start_codon:yes stop_codon:yes gene_type:complete
MSFDISNLIFLANNDDNDKIIGANTSQIIKIINDNELLNGETGPTGPQGLNGLDGQTGPTGPKGPQGLQGSQGAQGDQGVNGDTGLQGEEILITGPQGAQGTQGDNGAQGAQGTPITGPPGDSPMGLQGTAGSSVKEYVDLSDTPVTKPDDHTALVLNGVPNAIAHNPTRFTRIATDLAVNLSTGYYSVGMASTLGTVSGNNDTLICSNSAQNNITSGNNYCVNAVNYYCRFTGSSNEFSIISGSRKCDLINNNRYVSILASGTCTSTNTKASVILNSDLCMLTDNLNATPGYFNSIIQSQNCDIEGHRRSCVISSTDSIVQSLSGSQKYNHFMMSTRNCDAGNQIGNSNIIISSEDTNLLGGDYISAISCSNSGFNFNTAKGYYCSTFSSRNVTFNNSTDTTKNCFIATSNFSSTEGCNQAAIISCDSCSVGSNGDHTTNCTVISNNNSDIYRGVRNSAIISSNSSNIRDGTKNTLITASDSSNQDGSLVENCHISASDNCDVIPSNQTSLNTFISASDSCNVTGSSSKQIGIIASTNCTIAGTNTTNSAIMASNLCTISNAQQAAIISCYNCTNTGNNSALISLSGKSYNYTYTVSTGTLEYDSKVKLSDIRHKKDILKIDIDHNILKKINKVQVSRFRFNEDTQEHRYREGFIAQDLLEYFPQVISQTHVTNELCYKRDNNWYHDIDDTLVNKNIINSEFFKIDEKNSRKAKYEKKENNKRYSIKRADLSTLLWMALQKLIFDYKQLEIRKKHLNQRYENLLQFI